MNHAAVPSWCDLQAMWWFIHGSGGESQFRISLSNLSPASQSQYFRSGIATKQNNRRLDLFLSQANLCRISDGQTGQSDIELARPLQQNAPRASRSPSRRGLSYKGIPEERTLNRQWVTSLADLLTFHDCIHTLDQSVDHIKNLGYGCSSFILR